MALSELQLQDRQYSIGDIGLALLLSSIISLGYLATFYQLFPQYTFPIIFTIVMGLFGMAFAVGTGALVFKVSPLRVTTLLVGILGVVLILVFGTFSQLLTPSPQGSIFILLPATAALLFFGFVGVQEEFLWRGIYAGMRRLFPGTKSFFIILLIIFIGGIVFHQAVAYTLFQGTLFSTPFYFIWIGISWMLYAIMLEFTKSFSSNTLAHFSLNLVITYINLKNLGAL